jgi:hypothetical protein
MPFFLLIFSGRETKSVFFRSGNFHMPFGVFDFKGRAISPAGGAKCMIFFPLIAECFQMSGPDLWITCGKTRYSASNLLNDKKLTALYW